MNLRKYKRAGYPAVAVETFEDSRFAESLLSEFPDREVYQIAASGGLIDRRTSKQADPGATYPKAFQAVAAKQNAFLIVLDFQHIVRGAAAYRPLLDAMTLAKSNGALFVLLAPHWELPAELQHELPVLSEPLPDEQALAASLDVVLDAARETYNTPEPDEHDRGRLLRAARGLTRNEAENAFALAAAEGLKPAEVEAEKMRLVRSRCMSVETPQDPASLGGLGQLKAYVAEEVLPGRDDVMLQVRGLLLVGVPGTGKSLAARTIASQCNWPLVRLDVSAAKGSLVGESEATLRAALATVDAVAPCVLWVDEIEKAVGGHASSASTDGGTTLGMVGTLLTWLQEHTTPVLTVATCNDFAKLPPELARAGRFDERFFLDLPTDSERCEIAAIHLRKFGVEVDGLPAEVAKIAENWTGAEIEQLVKSAARRTKRAVTREALHTAAAQIIPISRSGNIQGLRDWARTNLRRANDADAVATSGRRLG